MKNFYKRFSVITRLPFWRRYLRIQHDRGLVDAKTLSGRTIFSGPDFTALLCGTSGEITTDEFIKSVYSVNSTAKIIIIDLGNEQIDSVIKLIDKFYPSRNIVVKQANALNLDFIEKATIDWIETDGFLGFFDEKTLPLLLLEWKRILKDNGFITFRDFATTSLLGCFIDWLRAKISIISIGLNLNRRSKKTLDKALSDAGFRFVTKPTIIPDFYRYCLIK